MSILMPCPACQHDGSTVLECRSSPGYIRRRRQCQQCRHRWTTREIITSAYSGEDAQEYPVLTTDPERGLILLKASPVVVLEYEPQQFLVFRDQVVEFARRVIVNEEELT